MSDYENLPYDYQIIMNETELEDYNSVIDQFLNLTTTKFSIPEELYNRIGSNAKELSARLPITEKLELPLLNKTNAKLNLAIPLLKTDHPDIASLLEDNSKIIMQFFDSHGAESDEAGIKQPMSYAGLSLADDVGYTTLQRFLGLSEERDLLKNTAKSMNDETRCRPIDRDLSDRWQLLADHIKDAQEGTADEDNYSKLLDNYTTETVTRMQQQKIEEQLADQRRLELSKSRQEQEIQQTKQRAQLLHDAVEYLRQECVKRNKGEQQ